MGHFWQHSRSYDRQPMSLFVKMSQDARKEILHILNKGFHISYVPASRDKVLFDLDAMVSEIYTPLIIRAI